MPPFFLTTLLLSFYVVVREINAAETRPIETPEVEEIVYEYGYSPEPKPDTPVPSPSSKHNVNSDLHGLLNATYSTTYNNLVFTSKITIGEDNVVSGHYNFRDGKLRLLLDMEASSLRGNWSQSSGKENCTETGPQGSKHWGTVEMQFIGSNWDVFNGSFGHCGNSANDYWIGTKLY